ncbi:hypothetical protein C8R42DRAFT_643855 [Lentinula raphanica]|nr:hypothetical protein C8R42DRAFT_643855 [Lentinula raphanica]
MQETQSENSRSKSKPNRKGKGKEVLMVPLEQRIATGREAEPRESPIPLSQRMSPMREDTEPPAVIASTTASSDAGSVVIRLPQSTLSTEFNPHPQPRVEEGSGRTAEPYEGPGVVNHHGWTRVYREFPGQASSESTDPSGGVLCELVFLPGAYERILAAPGISPHTTHRPGPLPMYAGPVGVEQIAYDLALRGYTPAHLSDLALYLMWWVQDIAHEIPNVGLAVQQQFVHVVRDVLVQHAHRGVPRSGPRFTEQYVFSDGSTRDNIEAAGRFAELQLIVEALRLKADRISPQEAGVGEAGASNEPQPQPSTADIAADVPETVDWDQVTHDENGDPILDYGDGDKTGMDMAR